MKSCVNIPGGVSGVRFRNSLLWEFLELPNSLYLNPSSLSLLSPLLSSIHELDQARQTFSGCYAFGITLEKVDLDLRGAHHDIRLSRTLRLDSLGINSFGIELSR